MPCGERGGDGSDPFKEIEFCRNSLISNLCIFVIAFCFLTGLISKVYPLWHFLIFRFYFEKLHSILNKMTLLDPRRSRKGSYKFGPVRTSVRPYVRNAFLRNRSSDFSDFLHVVITSKMLESDGARFLKKNLDPPPGRSQKVKIGPKMEFFHNISQTLHRIFLIFCMKLDNNKCFILV